MQTDGTTDVTELIVAFRNFVKAPKNGLLIHRRENIRLGTVEANYIKAN
jgi:hypothetical protein